MMRYAKWIRVQMRTQAAMEILRELHDDMDIEELNGSAAVVQDVINDLVLIERQAGKGAQKRHLELLGVSHADDN